jgi:hypothetical protein
MNHNSHTVQPEHSITCLFCGELADERRTTNIHPDIDDLRPSLIIDAPIRRQAILEAAKQHGSGEAHQDCFDEFEEQLSREKKAVADLETVNLLSAIALDKIQDDKPSEAETALQEIKARSETWSDRDD